MRFLRRKPKDDYVPQPGERRYDVGFYIGPCTEEDATALADAILDLPEFRTVHGGCVGLGVVADDDPLFAA